MVMNSEELGASIAAAHGRLQTMEAALSGLDRQIAEAEAQRKKASDAEAFLLNARLRDLAAQRISGAELVDEARRQFAAKQAEYQRAVRDAVNNLSKIGKACESAAVRFDRALDDAFAALAEIEAAADPLERTLLPDGSIARNHVAFRQVIEAVRAAFASRLNRVEAVQDRRTMAANIAHMMSTARNNAAATKNRETVDAA